MVQHSIEIIESPFIIATGNRGKRDEFVELLDAFIDKTWTVHDRASFPGDLPRIEEDKLTFFENAIKKAAETAISSGCCALADDSGLEVDALKGEPGVRSARFAGEDAADEENNRLLLQRLRGVGKSDRTARFVAVVCLALPNNEVARAILKRRGVRYDDIHTEVSGEEGNLARVGDLVVVWFRGVLEGRITTKPCGSSGFGYDPYFLVPSLDKCMGEMSLMEKNQISHRAIAVKKLVEFFTPKA